MWTITLVRRSAFVAVAAFSILAALVQLIRIIITPQLSFDAQFMAFGSLVMFEIFFLFRQKASIFDDQDRPGSYLIQLEITFALALAMPLVPATRDALVLLLVPVVAFFVAIMADPREIALGNAIACVAAFLVVPGDSIDPSRFIYLVSGLFAGPLGLAMVMIRQEEAELHRKLDHASWAASELSSLTMRLDRTVFEERRKASTRERRRIAQDIHDTVGHALTALIGLVDQFRNFDLPPEATNRVSLVDEYLRTTLRQVREEVDELRRPRRSWSEHQDWTNNVLRLCDVFSECTQVNVETENVSLERLPNDQSEEVFRIIQECLANSFRHGHAENVLISSRVDTERETFMMKISDDGYGAKNPSPGNGLTGMQERLSRFGGALEWKSIEGSGFDVAMEIPLGERIEPQP